MHPAGAPQEAMTSPRLETELLSSCSSAICLPTSLSTHTPLAQASLDTCHVQGLPGKSAEGELQQPLQCQPSPAGSRRPEEHNPEHESGRAPKQKQTALAFGGSHESGLLPEGHPQIPRPPPIRSNAGEALHSGPSPCVESGSSVREGVACSFRRRLTVQFPYRSPPQLRPWLPTQADDVRRGHGAGCWHP